MWGRFATCGRFSTRLPICFQSPRRFHRSPTQFPSPSAPPAHPPLAYPILIRGVLPTLKKVFISYSHLQGEWIFDRLYPCLLAGGAEVLIDRTRFEAGLAVFDQMDRTQDQADIHLLVLSPDYLASPACRHELDRAIAADPDFRNGRVIPLMRAPCALPAAIARPNPLYVNLSDDRDAAQWDLLLRAAAPDWLQARDQVRELLRRARTVNLVVTGHPKRREFIDLIRQDLGGKLAIVDLESGAAVSRRS